MAGPPLAPHSEKSSVSVMLKSSSSADAIAGQRAMVIRRASISVVMGFLFIVLLLFLSGVLFSYRVSEYSRVEPRTVKATMKSFPNSRAMAVVIFLISFSFLFFMSVVVF
jgi:hypothetical protein